MHTARTTSRTSTRTSSRTSDRRRARFAAGTRLALATGIVVGVPLVGTAASAAPAGIDDVVIAEATCPGSGKVETPESPASVTVTAPEGMLIAGYCVKAGSANQGDGPEHVLIDPPVVEVTFSHSSGKGISHYTIVYVEAPEDPQVPEDKAPPVDEPGEPQPEDPQVPEDKAPPVDEPGEPQPPVDEPVDPQPAEPEVESLPPVPAPEDSPAGPAPADQPAAPAAPAALPSTGSATGVLAALAAGLTGLGALTTAAAARSARRRA